MKRSVFALVCTAVLAVLIVMPIALSERPSPQSALQNEISVPTDYPDGELRPVENDNSADIVTTDSGVNVNDEGYLVDGELESAAQADALDDGPEHAPGVVLVRVAEGVPLDEVNGRLAELDYVATPSVAEGDVHFGYVKFDLANGVEVQDAINRLEHEGFTSAAQPNYVYHVLEGVDESAYAAASPDSDGPALQPATSPDLAAQTTSINDLYSKLNSASSDTRWMLTAINAYQAWDHTNGRANHRVTVAVIDSGVNGGHDDLKNNLVAGYDFVNDDNDPTDDNGHGTHVAGIIAAQANNSIGVAGVSYNAYIMPVKVINSGGGIDTFEAIQGLEYVLAHQYDNPSAPVRVANMSFGGPFSGNVTASKSDSDNEDACFLAAVDDLQAANILTVFAAGNYADRVGHVRSGAMTTESPYKCFPCDFDAESIGVINLDHNGASYFRATGSNYNVGNARTKELSAPGSSIYSTVKGGSYDYMSGTSMATPCVSGVAAMLFAANPSLTATQVKNTLTNTAQKISGSNWNAQTGYGMVDAAAALQAVDPDGAPLIAGDDKVSVGKSKQLGINNSSASWSWSSSDTSIATVSGGKVTGVKAGTVTITATSDNVSLAQAVYVYDPAIQGGNSLLVGAASQLGVSSANPAGTWKWTTSDSSVVRILDDTSGRIYGESLGTATVTATLVADTTVSASLEITVTSSDIANATVIGVVDQVYTGQPVTLPNLVVRTYSSAGGVTGYTTLREGVDYDVAYSDNTEIGMATVIITGKGNYAGTYTDTFRIGRYGLTSATTAQVNQTSMTYTGSALKPGVTIVVDGKTLVESTDNGQTGDYTLEYANNVNVGTATVTVTGVNDYVGTLVGNFAIAAVPITSGSITVSGIVPKTYTGSAITQTPTLEYNGMTLVKDKDYYLSYSNNVNAGTATVRIQGLGNYATYSNLIFPVYRNETFSIAPAAISGASFTFGSATYNGASQKLTPASASFNGRSLALGTDYTISYPPDCTNAGTKTVAINAKAGGNFTGSKSASYTIGKKAATITANSKSKAYDGTALTASQAGYTAIGFVNTSTDIASVSLSGSITNVGKATSAVASYVLSSSASSNYTVTKKTGTLQVTAADLSLASVTLSLTSYTYDGAAKKPAVIVRLGTRTLANGTDYTVSYYNNVSPGTATVEVSATANGNYASSKTATFTISEAALESYAGSNRYDTAKKIALAECALPGASYEGVIVCSCNEGKFPDALSAAGLSGVLGYPVVAVNGMGLEPSDREALAAMQSSCPSRSLNILVVGGEATVSAAVRAELSAYGRVSFPFAGADRYETNRLICEYGAVHGGWSTSQAFIASGANFPDAMTIAPYLVWAKCPIVLVDPSASSLSPAQRSAVAGAAQVVALGGTASVPERLLTQAASASARGSSLRLGGATRYETSAAIVEWELGRGMTLEGAGFATGQAFPDALASSYLLGSRGSVLGLVSPSGNNPNMLSVVSAAAARKGVPSTMRVFGGIASVPTSVRNQLAQAAGWPSWNAASN